MDLKEATNIAIDLMIKHELWDWNFDYHTRKSAFGTCNYTKKTIFLSAPLTLACQEHAVKDTMLHEIAHALVGPGHNHDYIWERKAIEIGCNGQRCNHYDDMDVSNVRYKYVAHCPKCGRMFGVSRRKKRRSSCPCTGNHFSTASELNFIQQY